jgi:TolB-like protein/DNA-binding winged helix-turn-helix (wHTH) protein/lipopolysaccharide biosynthesis regulator YciM
LSRGKINIINHLQPCIFCFKQAVRAFSQPVLYCKAPAMDNGGPRPRRFRFATFEVDAHAGEITKQGRKVKLQEQPFEILVALLERPGELLTREELKERLWPGDAVLDFDRGLNRAINRIRDALGDSADSPRFVETIPKRGYRLIVGVEELDAPPASSALGVLPKEDASRSAAPVARPAMVRAGKRTALVAAVTMLAAAVVFSQAQWRSRLTGSPAGFSIHSIAVLPFENLSNDPAQDYVADGTTDELITDLAKLKDTRIISRTSVMFYKGKRQPLPAIASALSVDGVVEGSVAVSGRRVRITAQLLLAREDRHLWAQSYERDLTDVLIVQREIAAAIAREVRSRIAPAPGPAAASLNAAAYDDYLQGRFYWNRRNAAATATAIQYFERAIRAEPNLALAYAGLAECYSIMWAEHHDASWRLKNAADQENLAAKAAAAVRALEIDSNLAEAHGSLGYMYLYHAWDWEAAKRELDRAVDLNANEADAHDWLSHYFVARGQFDASLAESKTALQVDPLAPLRRAHMIWHYLEARQYDNVIQQGPRLLEQSPEMVGVMLFLGKAYERKGMMRESLDVLQKFALAVHDSPGAVAALGHAYAVAGERDKARALVSQLLTRSTHEFVSPEDIAEIYYGLRSRAEALDWLERAYAARSPGMIYLGETPEVDFLRSEPRFQALIDKLRLPRTARAGG